MKKQKPSPDTTCGHMPFNDNGIQDLHMKNTERKFRGWYTHEILVLSLSEIQQSAKDYGIELVDPENPTDKELAKVYKKQFEEMSDPWEITANGRCKVQEIKENEIK